MNGYLRDIATMGMAEGVYGVVAFTSGSHHDDTQKLQNGLTKSVKSE